MEYLVKPGASLLSESAKKGLIPLHISNQSQLNDLENKNIKQAMNWAFSHKRSNLLTYEMVLKLHGKMFAHIWTWAGVLRKSETNIGVPFHQIPMRLKQLIDDTNYRISHSIYPIDDLVIRLHVDLVQIHVFENGNGRHARLLADLILFNQDKPFLKWGSTTLNKESQWRATYINALKIADSTKNYQPIIDFCK